MKYIKGFFAFWYDFIVGDAWEVAAGVFVMLLLLYVGVHLGSTWVSTFGPFIFPAAIVALLAFSLWRAAEAEKEL